MMVRKAFLASQTVRACSPDYRNETMHRAKGGNNSKIAHQSQRQMIKIPSQLYFSAHFIIFFALVTMASYIAFIVLSFVFQPLLKLRASLLHSCFSSFCFYFEAAFFYDCIELRVCAHFTAYRFTYFSFSFRILLHICLLWF